MSRDQFFMYLHNIRQLAFENMYGSGHSRRYLQFEHNRASVSPYAECEATNPTWVSIIQLSYFRSRKINISQKWNNKLIEI